MNWLLCSICSGNAACLHGFDFATAIVLGTVALYLTVFRPGLIYAAGRSIYNHFVTSPAKMLPKQDMRGRHLPARIMLLLLTTACYFGAVQHALNEKPPNTLCARMSG